MFDLRGDSVEVYNGLVRTGAGTRLWIERRTGQQTTGSHGQTNKEDFITHQADRVSPFMVLLFQL